MEFRYQPAGVLLNPRVGKCFYLTIAVPHAAQAQTFNVIHNFSGGQDGATPYTGLTMDKAGNFYGTTYAGGSSKLGTVYRLKRSGSSWVADGLSLLNESVSGNMLQANHGTSGAATR